MPPIFPHLVRLKTRLQEHFGERFLGLTLFGSHARNEARPDSDVDVLLILRNGSDLSLAFRSALPILSRFLLDSGILISLVIKTEGDVNVQREGLMHTISNEGIPL